MGKKKFLFGKRDVMVGLDRISPNIISLKFKGKNIWDKNQCARISVYDYLTGKEYNSFSHKLKILDWEEKSEVLFLKWRFLSAPFIIKQTFKVIENDAISYETHISIQKGKYRTVMVKFDFPLPSYKNSPHSDWNIWSASPTAPWKIKKINHLTISYDHIWEHTSIPAVTLYDEKSDIGQTFLKPFEIPAPGLSFKITNVRDWNVENERTLGIINNYLGCGEGRDANVSLIIKFHKGDWRDGLGWLCSKYKEYFEPYDEKIWEYF